MLLWNTATPTHLTEKQQKTPQLLGRGVLIVSNL